MNASVDITEPADQALALYPELRDMVAEFRKFRPEMLPSRYWEELNRKNLAQLADSRYENFKRTLARNYFTWIVNPLNKQIRFLMSEAGFFTSLGILSGALFAPRHAYLKKRHTVYYNTLTQLLWRYVEKTDQEGLLDRLIEPAEGNPPQSVYYRFGFSGYQLDPRLGSAVLWSGMNV